MPALVRYLLIPLVLSAVGWAGRMWLIETPAVQVIAESNAVALREIQEKLDFFDVRWTETEKNLVRVIALDEAMGARIQNLETDNQNHHSNRCTSVDCAEIRKRLGRLESAFIKK